MWVGAPRTKGGAPFACHHSQRSLWAATVTHREGLRVHTTDPHGRYLATRRFPTLDGLRAIAVLAVVWQHTARSDALHGLAGTGYYGVDLFFGISGFLITTLLLREHARTGRVDVRAFYARRTLRIFPLYFAALGVYAVATAATQLDTAKGREFFHHLPAFATYTSNWFVPEDGNGTTFYFAWSLATEEQFYLVWPPVLLVALGFLSHGRRWAATAVGSVLTADLLATYLVDSGALGWRILESVATPICVGALLALALHSRAGFSRLAPWLGHRAAVPVFATLVVALLLVGAPRPLVGAILAGLAAACCVREDHLAAPVLTWRPLVHVGVVSYGVYLLHMLCANLARPLVGHHGPLLFLITTALVLGAASASWRWFETPILRYKQRRFERVAAGAGPAVVPSRGRTRRGDL